MSTTTVARTDERAVRRHATPEPIPRSRILRVELAKMFDTRSGFWLMASIAIASVIATTAVILFAPDDELTYDTFGTAVGAPIAIILPMVAILAVTSEWSQRSGLTTFTLVPHRGRVIGAKLTLTIAVGIVSMALAFAIGALGNVLGTAITGVDTTWGVSFTDFLQIVLANVLGMLVGFMLAVLIRSSAGAIVAYFVYALLLPTASGALAGSQQWYADNSPWFDFNYAQSALFNGHMSTEQWAQLGTSSLLWLAVPLLVGLRVVVRSEVK
jgi:hypothetical protein